jgi:hypothetical protein
MATTSSIVSSTVEVILPSSGPTGSSSEFKGSIKFDNPVHCGYMLTFCKAEFSEENLTFIIEVDRLKDKMLAEPHVWKKKWQEIDKDFGFLGNFRRDAVSKRDSNSGISKRDITSHHKVCSIYPPKAYLWPSLIVSKELIEIEVLRIWKEFIERNSPSEICLSPPVIERTAFRMKYLYMYGPDVFTEAIEEHVCVTLELDTVPRFSHSDVYTKMSTLLYTFQEDDLIEVPLPQNKVLAISSRENLKNKTFELIEVLSDGILYTEYLEYLELNSNEKWLLCLQLISLFEEEINLVHDDLGSAEDSALLVEQYAWEIYNFFITKNSKFEIAFTEKDKKEIMRHLAKPASQMFEILRDLCDEKLETYFILFQLTEQYQHLNTIMINALQKDLVAEGSVVPKEVHMTGCLHFLLH